MAAPENSRGGKVAGLLTGAQIRMARAALKWSVSQLNRESDVGEKTIWRLERSQGLPAHTTIETLLQLRRTFEAAGIKFLDDDGNGPGIRCRLVSEKA